MEADVIFMTQSRATWRRAFQGCFQQKDDDDAFKGDAGNDDALRAQTHSVDIGKSVALLFSSFVALLILPVVTNSDPSIPWEVKFL